MAQFAKWMVAFALSAVLAQAQTDAVPPEDRRNIDQPNTKFKYPVPQYNDRAAWEKQRQALRSQILTAAGLDPMPAKTPLKPRVLSTQIVQGVVVENVLIETMPGLYLAGNIYKPAAGGTKRPAVLTPHGHWKNGRLENTDEFSGPSLGYHLARLGFVAFAYDMLGYNDTRQFPHEFGASEESKLWAFHPLGLQLWNSIRALDYVISLPNVDASRIAVTGASGGGTQTFLLAAVDARVAAIAPVNMISAHFQGGCDCENAPGLRFGTNNMEIGAMFAPKPMLMVAATGDWTRDTPKIEFPAVRGIYELFDARANVETIQFDTGHNYNRASREAVYRFLSKRLLSQQECSLCTEVDLPIQQVDSLRVLKGIEMPEDALPADGVRELWITESRSAAMTDAIPVVKRRLQAAMAVEIPAKVVSLRTEDAMYLGRSGRGDRIPAVWVPKDKKAGVVVVHPDGGAAAQAWWNEHAGTRQSASVLFIDAFQTGRAVHAKSGGGGSHDLTFNRTDDANRVQDVLTAIAFLKQQGFEQVTLVGLERAAVWCLFAAAVAPAPLTLSARLGDFDGSDAAFKKTFYVPGIQRAGGLPAVLRVLRSGTVQWGEATGRTPYN